MNTIRFLLVVFVLILSVPAQIQGKTHASINPTQELACEDPNPNEPFDGPFWGENLVWINNVPMTGALCYNMNDEDWGLLAQNSQSPQTITFTIEKSESVETRFQIGVMRRDLTVLNLSQSNSTTGSTTLSTSLPFGAYLIKLTDLLNTGEVKAYTVTANFSNPQPIANITANLLAPEVGFPNHNIEVTQEYNCSVIGFCDTIQWYAGDGVSNFYTRTLSLQAAGTVTATFSYEVPGVVVPQAQLRYGRLPLFTSANDIRIVVPKQVLVPVIFR